MNIFVARQVLTVGERCEFPFDAIRRRSPVENQGPGPAGDLLTGSALGGSL